jgi:hypothetical protein
MVWADHMTLKTYEGNFEKNQMHGKGKLFLKNGMVYEGEMFENKIEGYGVLTTASYATAG